MVRKGELRPYPLIIQILVLVVMTLVEAMLVLIGPFSLPLIGPVALLIPVFVMIGLWLGPWGVLAGYFGWFLAGIAGAGLHALNPEGVLMAVIAAFEGLWLISIPSVVVALADADLSLPRPGDLAVLMTGFILSFCVLLFWIYFTGILTETLKGGVVSAGYLGSPFAVASAAFYTNLVPFFLPVLIITPILLRICTPRIRYTMLYLRAQPGE